MRGFERYWQSQPDDLFRARLDEVITAHQAAAIRRMMSNGYSHKNAIRRLLNLGLERELGGLWVRGKAAYDDELAKYRA